MSSAHSEIETSSSLIRHAQEMDHDAWNRLTNLYAPEVYRWARLAGLQPDDAGEIVQEVFHRLFLKLGQFEKNSFRGWLWTVTRNTVYGFHRDRKSRPDSSGGTDFHNLMQNVPKVEPAGDVIEPDQTTTSERIVQRALAIIKNDFNESTWQAFWMSAIEQRSYREIAEKLNMREGTIRQARYRVTQRLKEVLAMFE